MLVIRDLKKYYNSGNSIIKAVDGITYSFEMGKFYAVIGRSGSGKSTFLSLLGALINEDSGSILKDDMDVTALSEKQKAIYRNEKVGFVFQNYCLEPQYTCFENILLPTIPNGKSKRNYTARVYELLDQLGLSDRADHKVKELSGGEKQRTAIARALINDPDIILADEPTGNLDSENGRKIINILRGIASQGKMVIMITHNMDDASNADVILRLSDGKLVEDNR